jgi:ubiquinone/menaquinone biosynthesis C-methylase UbiE
MNVRAETPTNLAGGKPAADEDFILARRFRLALAFAPPSGTVLLDFGCGTGAQTVLFADYFDLLLGADVSEDYLKAFKERAGSKGLVGRLQGLQYDGFRLPLADQSVDYAISFEVLEHVENESEALRELHRVMKPGASLVMSVPNRWWIFETHGASLPLLPWNRVPLFSWLPKKIHDRYARARIYRRREIVSKLQSHDFEIERSAYITAPMDVLKWRALRDALRATVFSGDVTRIPFLATAVIVIARRA